MKRSLFFLLVLLFCLHGYAQKRIVNGQETGYEEYQGAVGLLLYSGYSPMGGCTGTLIHPQVVLTAGHCVTDESGNKFSRIDIQGGEDISDHTYTTAQKIYPHENWNGNAGGSVDLGLIYLAEPINNVNYYALPSQSAAVGTLGVAVGYGDTGWEYNQAGPHRKGSAKIIDFASQCIINIGGRKSEGLSGVCSGDSGGPFFVEENGREVVLGVASYVTNYCDGMDGHEVYVPCYRDWIIKTVKEQFGVTLSDPSGNVEPECTSASDCGTGYECVGGICLEEAEDYSCSEIYDCISECAQNDEGCRQKCYSDGSAEGKQQFENMVSCLNTHCSNLQGDAFQECASANCREPIETCLSLPSNGDLTCEGIYDCFQDCSNDDQECLQECYKNGSEKGQSDYQALSSCVEKNCGDAADKGKCAAEKCRTEAEVCVPGIIPGEKTCKEIDDCIGNCSTNECAQECYEEGTFEARDELMAMYECRKENCPNLQGASLLACSYEKCGSQTEVCVGPEGNEGEGPNTGNDNDAVDDSDGNAGEDTGGDAGEDLEGNEDGDKSDSGSDPDGESKIEEKGSSSISKKSSGCSSILI